MREEERIVTRTLYTFMVAALIGSVLVVTSSLIQSRGVFTSVGVSGAVGIVTCLVVLWLLRMEQFIVPRILLPSAVYLLATYLIFTGATVSVRDDAVFLYALVVTMAGVLLRRRGVVIFSVLSILAVLASVYAELQRIIVNQITTNTSNYVTMVTVGVTYGLTFTMMYILVNLLINNLAHSRSDQEGLAAANEQLVAVRESLEQLVDARTRAAEKARTEAEAARREAQTQAWFAHGQAQFAEKMRGELDIFALANNMISHLSQYLGAQRGALFISSGESLKLAGWHGYEARDGQKSEFRLGEGLVGESARSKKVIRVEDIPADTALGKSAMQEILIVPLESNGKVHGVVEFATLNKFASEHETFLNRISESAAIALHTAQTRMQVNQILNNMRTGLKS